ncbi:5-hydroxymethyluracil DNA glycosylase [Pontibacillus halophilus JSM 076056 = DSM 19796]|uniref:Formamidopyrimidine-DNA glycosylase n=1 Tax=Pontibacillus halophilus JSM 076056 = DSM 19796 TaxID=1385510 RepID=A0A0A5GJG0_9BACI|nr:DNA-formamidopyrimidine glycosylase [Pontibacillus halophilus]KGX93391.1 5-hydroxymethyluracil DNA glycosylase [Pontibacillus halophilus JSM 076056 = DSM 19796]
MPELPEVETVKRTLDQLILNKTVQDIEVKWDNIIQRPKEVQEFIELLVDQTVQSVSRRGKFLLIYFDTHVLVSHLRMEGKYAVHPTDAEVANHTHVLFHFTDGTDLRYQDVRKFGTMHIFQIGEEFNHAPLNQLGPEPFSDSFTADYLYERLHRTSRHVKTALLDQTVVAGLGNIYVDEVLFNAGIHPMRRGMDLTHGETEVLVKETAAVLASSIEQGGSTIRTYLNSQGQIGSFQKQLNVYSKEDEPCVTCGAPIVKMKVGQRGTHVCLNCQK